MKSYIEGILTNGPIFYQIAVSIPFYEVHISDIETREEFRQKSYFSDIAIKVFSGHGTNGYSLALKEALKIS